MFRLILAAIVAFPVLSQAEESKSCLETAMTQSEINSCVYSINMEVAKQLDKLVSELKNILPDVPRKNLAAGQKAWKEVVQNDCEIESWYTEGGSANSMVVSSCYTEHARQRMKMLIPLLCHPMVSTCEARSRYEKNL